MCGITGDGDKHERLREPLRGAGHVLRSRGDAEVILHGYEELALMSELVWARHRAWYERSIEGRPS